MRDETQFHFSIPGGTAWIDDIAVTALADGENPPVTVKALEKK